MPRNQDNVEQYVTKDKSAVRELFHPASSPVTGVSVAEACVGKGLETDAHVHRRSQEIYYILEGAGTMHLGESTLKVKNGDAILIPPGTSHNIKADEGTAIRILCICSPPYAHEDTEFVRPREEAF
jgi:mannose-6-phosphate isomerase-like protein (cupin superfamily)